MALEAATPSDGESSGVQEQPAAKPWSSRAWAAWAPHASPADIPPVAIAALADAVAARGQPPASMIAALRAELAEATSEGMVTEDMARDEEATISRLELEMCHGPPRDKCAKCRSQQRAARMVPCGHKVLCTSCLGSVQAHLDARAGMNAAKLARLICPICRGFEWEPGAQADDVFSIIDTDGSGTIEPAELLVYLVVAGQEPEAVADLFVQLDSDRDGRISAEEWRSGYDLFEALAAHAPACALRNGAPPSCRSMPCTSGSDEQGSGGEAGEAVVGLDLAGGTLADGRPCEEGALASSDCIVSATADLLPEEIRLPLSLTVGHSSVQLPMELSLSVPTTPR